MSLEIWFGFGVAVRERILWSMWIDRNGNQVGLRS